MPIPLIIPLLAAAKMGNNIYRQQKNQEYVEAQKGLLEAQLKQLKASEQRQEATDAFVATLPPQQRAMFTMGKDPLETMIAMQMTGGFQGGGMQPSSPVQAPVITAGAGGGVPRPATPAGGILGMSPQQVTEQLIKKKLGLGEDKLMQRDFVHPETQRRGTVVYNLTTGQPRMETFVPAQRDLERVEITKNGKTMYQYLDKQTQQPVGEPVDKENLGEKALGSTEANTIALTKNSLKDAQTALDALFSDGSPDALKLLSARVEAPGTKGREFSQAWDRAVKPLMVALTGTGMSEREAANIISMSKPQIGDSPKSIQNKVTSLVGFMQDRLKLMDPQGKFGIVNVRLPWENQQAGKKDYYSEYGLTPPK